MCTHCIAHLAARRLTKGTARPCGTPSAGLHANGQPAVARDTDIDRYARPNFRRFVTPGTRSAQRYSIDRANHCRAFHAPGAHSGTAAPLRFPRLLEPRDVFCPVRAALCRISAGAASGAEPVPSRATKAYSIGRKKLAAAVLYDAAEPGLKQSRGGRHSTDGNFRRMPQDLANRIVRCHRMRGRRYERS